MGIKIQVRRGTRAQINAIIFDAGEPWYATDTKEFGIGDGVTAGGSTILQRKVVSVAVPNNTGTMAVDLTALGLGAPPTFVKATLYKANGSKATILAQERLDGLTATNVNVDFTANTPDATYVLKVLVIP